MIALILRGLFRSFEKTYKLMLKNFDLEHKEFHVFITTSNYTDKKYRFGRVSGKFLNINNLKTKIQNIVGNNLKHLEILDESKSKDHNKSRITKYINSLHNFIEFKKKNNIHYDYVIQHRMDVIFTYWETADKYYEARKVGEKREKGILKIPDFDFPIGVKMHGCCCIQACPKIEEVSVLKIEKLGKNEIYCYEDFQIGLTADNFLITSDDLELLTKQKQFWIDHKNRKFLSINNKFKKFNKIKSIQSYDYLNKNWIRNMWASASDYQFPLFLHLSNITLKCLRYTQDCSILIIR